MTLAKENNPSIADDHWAEAIVYTKGPNIVARESATTYEAAIDQLVEKLERQIERYRDKRVRRSRGGTRASALERASRVGRADRAGALAARSKDARAAARDAHRRLSLHARAVKR